MPSQAEKDYALRRVVYDVLVATKASTEFPKVRRDFSKKESLKVAALIMARNLNAFLYHSDYGHSDDIHVGDFGISGWSPSASAALCTPDKKRINKLVGHVVTSKPAPFKSDKEVLDLVTPLIEQSCEFIRQCRASDSGRYRGAAKSYVARLNGLLPALAVSTIPST